MRYPPVFEARKATKSAAKVVAIEMDCFHAHPLLRWNLQLNLIERLEIKTIFQRLVSAVRQTRPSPIADNTPAAPVNLCEENP
jgi:tRNA G37 N-methylase Trm5